jgi:hypothetical protein
VAILYVTNNCTSIYSNNSDRKNLYETGLFAHLDYALLTGRKFLPEEAACIMKEGSRRLASAAWET